jgi:DNA-binding PadR family transcriptional regulator
METLNDRLNKLSFSEGKCTDSAAAQDALQHTVGTFVSLVTSDWPEELYGLARRIFTVIPNERPTPPADAWITALETLAITSQRLYQRTAPKKEAMHLLEQPQPREVLRILSSRGRVQARDLRKAARIPYQSNLARLMRKLAQVGLVVVYREKDNSAWYRLTSAGRQLMQEYFRSRPEVRKKPDAANKSEVQKQRQKAGADEKSETPRPEPVRRVHRLKEVSNIRQGHGNLSNLFQRASKDFP